MATIFMDKIVKRIYESPTAAGLERLATKKATEVFDDAVTELKDDFEKSEVTQELDRGIGSPNISHTLRGADAPENLYSFIGFNAADDDGHTITDPIRERLEPSHPDGPKLRLRGRDNRGTSIRYQFVVDAPKEEKIWKETPIPWAPEMSWAKKIETSIAGFASFLPRFMGDPSRSGGGIQAKKKDGTPQILRSGDFVPPEDGYLTGIFKRFIDRFRRTR